VGEDGNLCGQVRAQCACRCVGRVGKEVGAVRAKAGQSVQASEAGASEGPLGYELPCVPMQSAWRV